MRWLLCRLVPLLRWPSQIPTSRCCHARLLCTSQDTSRSQDEKDTSITHANAAAMIPGVDVTSPHASTFASRTPCQTTPSTMDVATRTRATDRRK